MASHNEKVDKGDSPLTMASHNEKVDSGSFSSCRQSCINIYTDGSSMNQGAGWAYVAVSPNDDLVKERWDSLRSAPLTNNRAELTAIYYAILDHFNYDTINIYSDSQYSINSLTVWAKQWERNNWLTSKKQVPLNLDLIRKIIDMTNKKRVSFHHVYAHRDNSYNNRADFLAKEGAKKEGSYLI